MEKSFDFAWFHRSALKLFALAGFIIVFKDVFVPWVVESALWVMLASSLLIMVVTLKLWNWKSPMKTSWLTIFGSLVVLSGFAYSVWLLQYIYSDESSLLTLLVLPAAVSAMSVVFAFLALLYCQNRVRLIAKFISRLIRAGKGGST